MQGAPPTKRTLKTEYGGYMNKNRTNKHAIPDHVLESFARCILPLIQEFYATEEGQREFAEWKAKQEQQKNIEDAGAPG